MNDPVENLLTDPDFVATLEGRPSTDLAAYIVIYRSLGLGKGLAIRCMRELMRRQKKGDEFDFRAYIQQELDKIAKPSHTDYLKVIKGMLNKND